MRQKYRICQSKKKKTLNIQEYAVVEKDTKNVPSAVLRDDHFDLVAEQQYNAETIAQSAVLGCNAVVDMLRTPNWFPIGPYAEKIAETVIILTNEGSDRCIELFFDDNDLMAVDLPV